MSKVYLLWIGEYSDARVIGVFSTQAKAEDARVRVGKVFRVTDAETVRIEETLIDPDTTSLAQDGVVFQVWLDPSGNVLRVDEDTTLWLFSADDLAQVGELRHYPGPRGRNFNGFIWNGIARNREHAIKIAAEKRAVTLAQREGIA